MPKPVDCPEVRTSSSLIPVEPFQHLYNIMLECWQSQPEKRPTFETLMWQLEDGAPESGYREAEMFMR